MADIRTVDWSGPRGRDLVALRFAVYIREQAVPVDEEIDAYDPNALHLGAFEDDELVACLRIVVDGHTAKLGRLAVNKDHRRKGLATALLREALARAPSLGVTRLTLDAQRRVTHMYEALGFRQEGDPFQDAGIPHIRMVREVEG